MHTEENSEMFMLLGDRGNNLNSEIIPKKKRKEMKKNTVEIKLTEH